MARMTQEEQKSRIGALMARGQELAREFLNPARQATRRDGSGNIIYTFECPFPAPEGGICGRGGTGSSHKDGLVVYPNGAYKCLSCGAEGKNIVDLYMAVTGSTFMKALTDLEGKVGRVPSRQENETPKQPPAQPQDYTTYIQKWAADIEKTDYHRGISLETLKRYNVGYCANWIHPAVAQNPKYDEAWIASTASPRLIVPTSGYSYLARRTDGKADVKGEPKKYYEKSFVGVRYPFNLKALQESTGKPVFVLEGEIDALSVIDCGGLAIGLGGNTGTKYLLKALQENPFSYRLILVADADEKQDTAYRKLCEQIQGLGISCEVMAGSTLFGTAKDANEALNADKEAFKARLQEAENTRKAEVLNPWAGGVQSLVDKVQGNLFEPIPTGIPAINELLKGGCYNQQLFGITGRPGGGKTCLAQWICESLTINNMGLTAVYACFEMSKEQLQARSISRLMNEAGHPLTHLQVMRGEGGWREGAEAYNQLYGDKVLYLGDGTNLGTFEAKFKECVAYNRSIGRPAPFFVIDYLQLIRIKGMSEQEVITETMPKLKALAVKYNTFGIVISANNRESNKSNEAPNMFSGRGSSSLEYGFDCMLAVTPNEDDVNNKREDVHVTITVTKGRWIGQGQKKHFIFNGAKMSYTEATAEPLSTKEAKIANDLINQPDRQGEVENIPLNI